MQYDARLSLIDWISDTLSQGYTDLQSLVKCLDHRDIVSDTGCSQAKVVLGCASLCNQSQNSDAQIVSFQSGISRSKTCKH